jgi:hypothetical protein
MATAPVVVTRRTLHNALGSRFEAAGDELADALADQSEVPFSEALAQIDHVFQQLARHPGPDDVMVAPRDRLTSLYQSFINEHAADTNKVATLPAGGFEAKYDSNDLRWVTRTGIGWIRQQLDAGRYAWRDDPAPVETINDACRLAILSDWGTAMYGAPECAKAIASDGDFDLLLHLGDVYYAGTEREIRSQFLELWPRVPRAATRCLNGNHEMYSTGKAYFTMLPSFGQQGSYFAMTNRHWLLVGLDTAYTDHQLHGKQKEWLGELLGRYDGRKVVLFSHHQPYSLVEEPAQRLIAQLSPMLEGKRIFAWYWGHEHRCVIHDRHPLWNLYGRCVGHSGFPEFRHPSLGEPPAVPGFVRADRQGLLTPGGLLLDGPNRWIPGHEREYSPHGYVALQLDGPSLTEEYYEASGTLLHRQTLE